MGYINFKEEIAAAKEQLKNRKENNIIILEKMVYENYASKEYNIEKQYSYKTIKNKSFGYDDIKNENDFLQIKDTDIICCKFEQCNFKNIKFENCNFIGCIFNKCSFSAGGCVFENCNFLKENTSSTPSLNKKDNFSCYFNQCDLYVKFLKCNIGFNIFEKCKFNTSTFEKSDMTSLIIIYSTLNMIVITDSDLSGIKVVDTYIKDLEFRDKNKSKLDEKSFFDKINIKKKTRSEYEGIYTIYELLADKFKENGLNNNFGEYYYLCKITQVKTLKIIPKIQSYLYWFICGYGERPWYALNSALVFIFIFGIIYLFTGLNVDGEIVRYGLEDVININFNRLIRDLIDGINLSVGVFSGIGWTSSEPTELSYIVENIEVIIGVIMMGVGIGTLVRKVVR